MEKFDCIVIGGGPSGMMAAGTAAQAGKKVLLIERNNSLGEKLAISGKGRCNITNTGDIDKFLANYGKQGRFLYNCFHQFFNDDLISFFEDLKIRTKVERGGRVFPVSDEAHSIVNALKFFLMKNRVKIIFNKRVKEILTEDLRVNPVREPHFFTSLEKSFITGSSLSGDDRRLKSVAFSNGVNGIKTSDAEYYFSPSLVLATGGLSYPDTGSTGDGYEMAGKLGHRIIKCLPSLVGLVVNKPFVKELAGVSLKNVSASLFVKDKFIKSIFGEMVFTHSGLSGPIILSLSREVAQFLYEKEKEIIISLDLKPALNQESIDNRLLREIKNFDSRHYKNLLKELLPKSMIPVFISLSRIEADKKSNQITQSERKTISRLLSDFRFTIKGTLPIEEAIVTQGGVDTRQVNPKTMESRLIKGLYIVGELLDIDGLTGGYNLQAAFSTGYVAGKSITCPVRKC